MIVLDTTTKKLEIVLGGAVAATQPAVYASYVDVTDTTYVPGSYDTVSNNTTAVSVVFAPPEENMARQVKLLTIYNADSGSVTVTLRLNNNATTRILVKIALAAASTLVYTDGEGFRVIDTAGAIL